MDRKFLLTAGLVLSIAFVPGKAHAYSTTLINFPIADILKHREGMYLLGASGFARNVDKGFSWSQSATFGIFDKGELGVANDFLGHSVFDAKLQIYDAPKDGVSLSIGVAQYDADARTNDTFVCVRKDFANFRLHASAYKSDKIVGVFGVDFSCGKGCCSGWSGAIEHVTGTNSETWVALTSPMVAKGVSVTLASRFPWDGGSGPQYQAILNYGFRF